METLLNQCFFPSMHFTLVQPTGTLQCTMFTKMQIELSRPLPDPLTLTLN